jgi:hypothetical protein
MSEPVGRKPCRHLLFKRFSLSILNSPARMSRS